jgi:hypothetical protein
MGAQNHRGLNDTLETKFQSGGQLLRGMLPAVGVPTQRHCCGIQREWQLEKRGGSGLDV